VRVIKQGTKTEQEYGDSVFRWWLIDQHIIDTWEVINICDFSPFYYHGEPGMRFQQVPFIYQQGRHKTIVAQFSGLDI